MKLAGLLLAALLATLLGCGRPSERPPPAGPDGCAGCHAPAEGPPSGVHAALGCAACHLGDGAATVAGPAHAGLEREPGALDTVDRTCGATGCHADQAARVRDSLMATGAGIIAVDRWAFNEQALPDGHAGLPEDMAALLALTDPSPAQDHLRRLCAGCHLHARKADRDDAVQGVGSGCSACHSASRGSRWDAHPAIDRVVPDDRCLGCHSRSGRISLSYQGLAELRGRECQAPQALHDGRPGCRVQADLHHDAGLSCTDCHLHTELMGDGLRYAHEEQAVELSCEACHGPTDAEATWAQVEDPTSRRLLRQHGQAREPGERVRLGARGTPLWNLRPGEGGWWLQPKGGGEARLVRQTPTDATHGLPGHGRLDCATCHTPWAPLCADCHTDYDPQGEQWDFGRAAVAPGAWIEQATRFDWGPPALAVDARDRVVAAAPGMIATLDAREAGGPLVQTRRFAAVKPHTTARQGRPCTGCHQAPAALGLGTGRLDLDRLAFTPLVPVEGQPGLAADGWVPLQPPTPGEGTRVGLRSLDAAEQRRILRVGLCLDCHPTAQDPVYRDFPEALRRLGAGRAACPAGLPPWARTAAD